MSMRVVARATLLLLVVLCGVAWYLLRDQSAVTVNRSGERSATAATTRRSPARSRNGDGVEPEAVRGDVLHVMRLADGAPAAGIETKLIGRSSDGRRVEMSAVSDEQGVIRLGTDAEIEITQARPASGRWKSLRDEPDASGTIWVYEMVDAAGCVCRETEEAQLDMTRVSLSLEPMGFSPDGRACEPWTIETLAASGIKSTGLGSPERDGTFTRKVPGVRGIALQATARGWSGATVVVDLGAPADASRHRLVLRPLPRVRGRVTDASGRAVVGASVLAYVRLTLPAADARPARLITQFPGGGVRAGVRAGSAVADVRLTHMTTTDGEGDFELGIRAPGSTALFVLADGYRVAKRELSQVAADTAIDDWALAPAVGRRARLLLNGDSCAGQSVAISDHTEPWCPGWVVGVGEAGEVRADWLVVGHRYALVLLSADGSGPAAEGYVTWDDRDVIEFAGLEKGLVTR
jgi:hypothetical protein